MRGRRNSLPRKRSSLASSILICSFATSSWAVIRDLTWSLSSPDLCSITLA